jgi:hypothetical protein
LADYPSILLSGGLKRGTVDEHLVYIKAVFEAVKNVDLIEINPAENLVSRSLVSRMNVKKIRAERDAELAKIKKNIEQETDPILIRVYRAKYAYRQAEFVALLASPSERSEAIANRIRASIRYQEVNAKAIAIKIMETS